MMKKLLATLLTLCLLLSATACSVDPQQTEEATKATEVTTSTEAAEVPPTIETPAEIVTEEIKARFDAILEQNKYTGIVCLTHNGKVVYQSVSGNNDLGEPLTIESPMFIGSNSKQFCAAAIVMLRDQGKLSLDDTLEKYFPEYTIGKDITLHQLLSMQSGIVCDPVPDKDIEEYINQTAEENIADFKEVLFDDPLMFTPGTKFAYSNNNYRLLALVVEMASGQKYEDFIRQNIFQPVGMTHSGFISNVKDHPQWGLTCERLDVYGTVAGYTQGCGDIVATAGDMDLWMTALQSGQVISKESFQEMTSKHSVSYGYGLTPGTHGGWGHNGGLPGYTSRTYFNVEHGYQLFIATNNTPALITNITIKTADALLDTLFEAMDGASKDSGDAPAVTEPTDVTETTDSPAEVVTDEVKTLLDGVLEQCHYEGIISLTQNGKVVYQSVSGNNDLGEPLTIDSPMFIGSVSKQFCAAAIVMLRDQGKLTLDDPLSMYFPEYTIGKDITLKNLLTMQSGILRDVDPMLYHPEEYENNTDEENEALFKEYVFSQPLRFQPGTSWEYSNNGYRLLAFVVEMVSGQNYEDFIRQNIFEPLGMEHTGFKSDVKAGASWTHGLTFEHLVGQAKVAVLSKGAGGIVSTAADMDIWMRALRSGQVVSMESFREMTTNYKQAPHIDGYGYGIGGSVRNGWGHTGGNGNYTAFMYFNEETDYQLYLASNDPNINEAIHTTFLQTLYKAVGNS